MQSSILSNLVKMNLFMPAIATQLSWSLKNASRFWKGTSSLFHGLRHAGTTWRVDFCFKGGWSCHCCACPFWMLSLCARRAADEIWCIGHFCRWRGPCGVARCGMRCDKGFLFWNGFKLHVGNYRRKRSLLDRSFGSGDGDIGQCVCNFFQMIFKME